MYINNEPTKAFITSSGTPQGGVLSPDLFALLLHDMNEELSKIGKNKAFVFASPPTNHSTFADDIIIYTLSEDHMAQALKIVQDYLNKWGLTLAPDKCNYMIFNEPNIKYQPIDKLAPHDTMKMEGLNGWTRRNSETLINIRSKNTIFQLPWNKCPSTITHDYKLTDFQMNWNRILENLV